MIYACPACGRENRIPASRLDAQARCGNCKTALSPLDRPYDVPDTATFDEIVRSSPLPVVVDFWADWCGPCHAVAPELKKVATAQAGKVVVLKVDTERLRDVAGRFAIRSIPTMVRLDKGQETKRVSGAQPAAGITAALGLDRGSATAHAH